MSFFLLTLFLVSIFIFGFLKVLYFCDVFLFFIFSVIFVLLVFVFFGWGKLEESGDGRLPGQWTFGKERGRGVEWDIPKYPT